MSAALVIVTTPDSAALSFFLVMVPIASKKIAALPFKGLNSAIVADSILACKGGTRRSLRFLDDKHGFGLKTRRRLGESILCLDSLPKDEKCKFQSASFIFNMYFLRFLLLSLLI